MEAMEVDVVHQQDGPSGRGPRPDVGGAAGGRSSPVVIDSGSSTDIDDEEEEEGEGPSVAPHAARLPPTWAFSHRAERDVPIRAAARAAATQVTTRRRRVRMSLRVHYPSQTATANPSRGFLDFLLRAPAAHAAAAAEAESGGSTTEPMSGSTTEVSDSEEEDTPRPHAAAPPAPAAADLALPSGLRVSSGAPPPPPQALPRDPHPTAPTAATVRTEATEQSVQSSSSAASAAVTSAAAASSAVSLRSSQREEPEGEGDNNCPICFESFTSAGAHRLSALRCGHLFGFACIDRWLKSQGQTAKCPQCNKKAKRSDLVLLYARKLRALDNSEQESMKKSLEEEQSLRRRAELESAQCRLQLQVVTEECSKLRRQLQELKTLMSQSSSGSHQSSSSSLGQSQRAGDPSSSSRGVPAQYHFNRAVLVSQTGGCRVLSYCEPLSCLLASQNSPHATLVPGCGVKKISAVNMKASQYVPIHAKQIRGLAFNRQADSLMLSAALDNTIKLTSLMTNTVVQTYNTGKPVWSCCWSLDNNNYVYAGLMNGAVLVYDTRDTSTHVHQLEPLRSRCPVASLCYVPRAASSSFPCGGLIVGTLEGAYFWEQVDGTTYKPHMLPLETSGCTDIQVETESRHCLVTYRPGRSNPTLRSVLMELQRTPQQDAAQEPCCSCNPVQTFSGGSSCKLLTKNAVFSSPAGDGATLVCVGDEASNSTMVWDAGSGALLQKLPADLPVLDISPFTVNGDHYLASLTEKMLKVYKWE